MYLRYLFLLPFLMTACVITSEESPPRTTGPTGPGTNHPPPPFDGGMPQDGGENDGDHEPLFTCGEEAFTCEYADSFANCCDGVFYECDADFPYYCPSDTLCWFEEGLCVDEDSCTYTGQACSP